MTHPTLLSPQNSSLLVIDVQEKLVPLIPRRQELVRNVGFLLDAAKILSVAVQATEQYPKGLGPTVPELASKLPQRPDKLEFSCCAVPGFVAMLQSGGRNKVVLCGMETHVCVLQTALDLLARDLGVHVAVDAVASRGGMDHDVALRRLEAAGAVLTTCETAVFEWAGRSGTPEFKAISKLVQDRMKSLQNTSS